jgi:hypothetical protein
VNSKLIVLASLVALMSACSKNEDSKVSEPGISPVEGTERALADKPSETSVVNRGATTPPRGVGTTVVTPHGTTVVDGTGADVKTNTPGTPVKVKTTKAGSTVEVGGVKVNPGSVSVPGVANVNTC